MNTDDRDTISKETESARQIAEIGKLRKIIEKQEAKIFLLEENKKKDLENIRLLQHWLDYLNNHFNDFLKSWRWRIGDTVIRIIEKLLFKSRGLIATDHITTIFDRYQKWKKNFSSSIDRKNHKIYLDTSYFEKSKKKEMQHLGDYYTARQSDFEYSIEIRKSKFWQLVSNLEIQDQGFDPQFLASESWVQELMKKKNTVEPLVSIIMPTYNRAFLIGEAIQSIIEQSYQNWELLVCDDGSTDNTESVVNQFDDRRIQYFSLQHLGAAQARNSGLDKAKGEFFAYLDTDNLWHPCYLEVTVCFLVRNFGSYCAYSRYIDVKKDGGKNFVLSAYSDNPFNYTHLEIKNYIDLNTFVHRRSLFDVFGGFNSKLSRYQDWQLNFKV